MMQQKEALQQIEEINQAIRQSFMTLLPGSLLIAIGAGVACIPFIEIALSTWVDSYILLFSPTYVLFFLRAIFYWILFTFLSRAFVQKEELILHPAIQKAWALNSLFPIIPVATGGVLALAGYKQLAMPIVLILIGCYFALIGRFTQNIVTILAIIYFIVGIGSIYLTTFFISHLWMYLLVFQGFASIVAGLVLRYKPEHSKEI